MIPSAFDYVRASSVDDAIRLLGEHGDGAKLLAGGHSLIPMMKLRLASPSVLIDLAGIPQLDRVEVSRTRVTIGALTKHATLAASAELKKAAPVLWDAANDLGDPQVRNRGTIGGAAVSRRPVRGLPGRAAGAQRDVHRCRGRAARATLVGGAVLPRAVRHGTRGPTR